MNIQKKKNNIIDFYFNNLITLHLFKHATHAGHENESRIGDIFSL